MRKKLQDLTIKDAFMFAAVMSDTEQCRHLLELVLEMSILEVDVITETDGYGCIVCRRSI